MNKFYYIPPTIWDNIHNEVKDKDTIVHIVQAYRELIRGNDVGLFEYRVTDRVILESSNYDKKLEGLYNKCETINLCSSKLISLDLLPRKPKEIAKELHEWLVFKGVSNTHAIDTVKTLTGYKKATDFTQQEKGINEIRHDFYISPKTSS